MAGAGSGVKSGLGPATLWAQPEGQSSQHDGSLPRGHLGRRLQGVTSATVPKPATLKGQSSCDLSTRSARAGLAVADGERTYVVSQTLLYTHGFDKE